MTHAYVSESDLYMNEEAHINMTKEKEMDEMKVTFLSFFRFGDHMAAQSRCLQ